MPRTAIRAAFACLLAAAAALPQAGAIRVVISSAEGDRLAEKAPLAFTGAPPGTPAVSVDDSRRYQTMVGFGATFNEAGMISLNKLDEYVRERTLRSLFDPRAGSGFSVMAAPIGACDFASAGPYYSFAPVEGDVELKHFSIERDLNPDGLVPFIRKAMHYGSFRLQARPDYPPVWMLDERIDERGKVRMNLKREYYGAFARYLIRFIEEYRKQGIAVDALSPFNEPGVYTQISFPEIRDLIRDHLGPMLAKSGLKTQLQLSDSSNREVALREFPKVLADPEARKYISALPVHGYRWEQQGSEIIGKLQAMYPDIPIWQTEVCYAKSIDRRAMPVHGFEDGDRWGRMIAADVRNGAAAWVYWNMILDHNGGPYLASTRPFNIDDNQQHPVVIIDTRPEARGGDGRRVNWTQQVIYTGLYYYLSHFSKYVRPGAVRIHAETDADLLTAVAFEDAAHNKILQVINSSRAPARFALRHKGREALVTMPATSIATCTWN